MTPKKALTERRCLLSTYASPLNGIAALEGGGDPEDVLGVVFSSFCVGK